MKTDKEIRLQAKKDNKRYNGEYISKICAKCKRVETDPNSSTEDAQIVKVCKHCFDEE